MSDNDAASAMEVMNLVISSLSRLDEETRRRVLQAVATFFGVEAPNLPNQRVRSTPSTGLSGLAFSTDHAPTPKEFLLQKQPRTDVERVACLAYYLTHYRELPFFKTLDIGKLNTEAAQPKFSNAAYSVTNAVKMGYLAPAPKGQRQLSAAGEQFVLALPDREAAKAAMNNARPRRRVRKQRRDSAEEYELEAEDNDVDSNSHEP